MNISSLSQAWCKTDWTHWSIKNLLEKLKFDSMVWLTYLIFNYWLFKKFFAYKFGLLTFYPLLHFCFTIIVVIIMSSIYFIIGKKWICIDGMSAVKTINTPWLKAKRFCQIRKDQYLYPVLWFCRYEFSQKIFTVCILINSSSRVS